MLDIPKLLRKLSGLHNIASGQGDTPEGDNAQRQLDRMVEKAGVNLPEGSLEPHELSVDKKNDWDVDLLQLICLATHTEGGRLKSTPDKLRIKGLKIAVLEAEKHFYEQRKAVERLLGFVAMGYFMGSFGRDTFLEYLKKAAETGDISETLEAGLQENQERAEAEQEDVDVAPTKDEAATVKAAAVAGAKSRAQFWENLKKPV